MSNQSYHKRRRKASARRTAGAVLLAVVIVFVVVGVLFVQDSIVYTANGMEFLPQMFAEKAEKQTTAPPVQITLPPATTAAAGDSEIVDFTPLASGEVDAEDVELPEVNKKENRIGRVLRAESYCIENFAAQAHMLASSGEKAVVIDLKEPSGKLAYQSDSELAQKAQVNASDDEAYYLKTALTCLHNEGIRVFARISCFADSRLANAFPEMVRKNEAGLPSLSLSGYAMLNAGNGDLQDYLKSIVKDAVEMGFDALILDDFGSLPSAETNPEKMEDLLAELHELTGDATLALMLYPPAQYVQSDALSTEADELWAYQKGLDADYRIDGAGTLIKEEK